MKNTRNVINNLRKKNPAPQKEQDFFFIGHSSSNIGRPIV